MTDSKEDAFLHAARLVADGDLQALEQALDARPDLVLAHGPAPHRATLLHHTAANGIPDELQRPQPLAPRVATLLLERGAAPDALAGSYGGGPDQTALCLAVSSHHPFAAGVQRPLVRALIEGGAAVDGVLGDGGPIATALTFGYTGAAEELAALGSRLDSAIFRAGLGQVPELAALLDDPDPAAALGPYRPVLGGPPPADRAALVQEAFHVALTHGRLDVAELLLERGAEVNGVAAGHHCELPLLQSLFVGEAGSARWLLERGADPHLVDGKRGESARQLLEGRANG